MHFREAFPLRGHARDVFWGDDMQVIKRGLRHGDVGRQGGND